MRLKEDISIILFVAFLLPPVYPENLAAKDVIGVPKMSVIELKKTRKSGCGHYRCAQTKKLVEQYE